VNGKRGRGVLIPARGKKKTKRKAAQGGEKEQRMKAAQIKENEKEQRMKAAQIKENEKEQRMKAAQIKENEKEQRMKAAQIKENEKEKGGSISRDRASPAFPIPARLLASHVSWSWPCSSSCSRIILCPFALLT
jgi:hypothetical protein